MTTTDTPDTIKAAWNMMGVGHDNTREGLIELAAIASAYLPWTLAEQIDTLVATWEAGVVSTTDAVEMVDSLTWEQDKGDARYVLSIIGSTFSALGTIEEAVEFFASHEPDQETWDNTPDLDLDPLLAALDEFFGAAV